MIVILDTNVFFGDRRVTKARLSLVFDGAAHGDFDIAIPEVVVRELVRQFPERLQAAVKDAEQGLDAIRRTFGPLDLLPPTWTTPDVAALVGTYEADLRRRLSGRHCSIVPNPSTIGESVGWVVDRRKPFKNNGVGLQDAVIWLTALQLAAKDDVTLVSANTKDFSDGQDRPSLAKELIDDLQRAGLAPNRVRLIADLEELISELVRPSAEADKRAKRVMANDVLWSRVAAAIAAAVRFTPLDARDYPPELEDLPEVSVTNLDPLKIVSVGAAGKDRLRFEIQSTAAVVVQAKVNRDDVEEVADQLEADIEPADERDPTVAITWSDEVLIRCTVTTDTEVEDPEVHLTDVEVLGDVGRVERRLRSLGGEEELRAALRDLSRDEILVSTYTPRGGGGARADRAQLLRFELEEVEVEEVLDAELTAVLRVTGTGDVQWISNSPNPILVATYSPGGEETQGPLDGQAGSEPIELLVEAVPDNDGGWLDIRVVHAEQLDGEDPLAEVTAEIDR